MQNRLRISGIIVSLLLIVSNAFTEELSGEPLIYSSEDRIEKDERLVEEVNFEAQRTYIPSYLHLATGKLNELQNVPKYDWPFQFESIGWNISSYQKYGSNAYFHHGIDMRAPFGTDVYAPSGGRVVSVYKYGAEDVYWEIGILDNDGFIWQFHHIDENTIPQAVWDAYYDQTPLAPYTYIGKIVQWPAAQFHHVHLNIWGADSSYLNPFIFLEPFPDMYKPKITEIGLLVNKEKYPDTIVSEASYSIYIQTHDLIMHDSCYMAPYSVTFSIDGMEEVVVWKFDSLPGRNNNQLYINDFFIPAYTCGDYDCRSFCIDLGFKKDGYRQFPMISGKHSITVTVSDFSGNKDTATFNWTVATDIFSDDFDADKEWVVNPFGTDNAKRGIWERGVPQQTAYQDITYQLGTAVNDSCALITGYRAGMDAGSYDIDEGTTSIRSPAISLIDATSAMLTFYYYFAYSNNASRDDFLRIKVIGTTTETVFEKRASSSAAQAAWCFESINLDAFAGQTIYLLIEAADAGSGSLVEAGIDKLRITGNITRNNKAPVVDAGPNRTVFISDTVFMEATVIDDALPDPPVNMSIEWMWVEGPAPVLFDDVTNVNTLVFFPQEGVYTLRITADDGEYLITDELTVNVTSTATVFFDNFETDKGWISDPFGTDRATVGLWERANPEQTTCQYGTYQLGTTVSGSYGLVTGAWAGLGVGEYDVDGGGTSIQSPEIALPAAENITLSFSYYFAHFNNTSSEDYLQMKILSARGEEIIFEKRGTNQMITADWQTCTIPITHYAGQNIYLLIEAADGGGGSLIEAGIDDCIINASITKK